jgi:hypothetical protein
MSVSVSAEASSLSATFTSLSAASAAVPMVPTIAAMQTQYFKSILIKFSLVFCS